MFNKKGETKMRTKLIPLELTEDELNIQSACCCIASVVIQDPGPDIALSMSQDNREMFLRAAYILATKNKEYAHYLEKVMKAGILTNITEGT